MVVFVLIATLCMGCGSHVPEDDIKAVQQTLAEADSLRGMGIIMGMPFRDTKDSCSVENHDRCRAENEDSLRLAEAVAALYPWRWVYADEYAKANYYYGRFLRAKDHYPEAMQCFIHAIHSRSKDYHILGRVYSNMGTISHLAGEYELSYEMYEHSADMFLRNGDTINYYYALNNMAFELAEQGKKEETFALLQRIESTCTDSIVLTRLLETRALACNMVNEYDSTIYYINRFQAKGDYQSNGYVLKAQAYWYLNQYDSALYYAQSALGMQLNSRGKISMLYIASHNDPSLGKDSILALTSERADLQNHLAEQNKSRTLAIAILRQDMSKRYDWRWIYAVIATLVIICSAIIVYIRIKKKHHKLLSQQIVDLENQKAIVLDDKYARLEAVCKLYANSTNLESDLCWMNFEKLSSIINQNFGLLVNKLQQNFHLNEREIRLCVLVLLGISNSKRMASMLCYSESGIRNFKNRTAKKLSTNSVELRDRLINIACGEASYLSKNEIVHA